MQITVFTIPGCYYCDQLKKLFERANVTSTIIVVGQDMDKNDFVESFPQVTGYPYVIIDGEPVGGLVETAKLFVEKGLVKARKAN